ncbi:MULTISPECIES: hypothetical protein [unclassified Mesorhizobium]|nr:MULTISPECIES: hypothetical protein [unclassified Mesorhizobium]
MTAFTSVRTADGTVIARDPLSGLTVSGTTQAGALAELRRLLAMKDAA